MLHSIGNRRIYVNGKIFCPLQPIYATNQYSSQYRLTCETVLFILSRGTKDKARKNNENHPQKTA
jgi:hypothetical protein